MSKSKRELIEKIKELQKEYTKTLKKKFKIELMLIERKNRDEIREMMEELQGDLYSLKEDLEADNAILDEMKEETRKKKVTFYATSGKKRVKISFKAKVRKNGRK